MSNILWIDDEVDSLKSQILFLENKGYHVAAMSNGYDGVEHLKENTVDAILLDETMPGMTGMETLEDIRMVNQQIPVIMVTKNEAEDVMEDAIGRQINDYLIKPVNPNQVLLALKKNIDNKRLVAEKTTTAYQQDFRNLFMTLSSSQDYNEWRDTYKKLVHWELQMAKSDSPEMQDVFNSQKAEANTEFAKYVTKNYKDWVHPKTPEAPIMSHTLFRYKIAPHIEKGKPLFVVLIDNLRFDQWKVIEPIFAEYFSLEEEDTFYSILPTATQYCRNAIFAGMMPVEIEKKFPMEWKNDNEQGGKNLHEETFLGAQLKNLDLDDIRYSYTKVTNHQSGQNMLNNIHNLLEYDLNVIVYNFVDMMSHARTEMEVLKELASDEVSYRSITKSWFKHSPLYQALAKLAQKDIRLMVTTDHGSVRVKKPLKVIGDRETTTNLRYKHGRNLNYNPNEVLAFKNPQDGGLPRPNVNSSFIFAKEEDYLCYPNNYNHYAKYYNDTFQHGGISLEEMIVPIIRMESKKQ